jgi:hypothetical protein
MTDVNGQGLAGGRGCGIGVAAAKFRLGECAEDVRSGWTAAGGDGEGFGCVPMASQRRLRQAFEKHYVLRFLTRCKLVENSLRRRQTSLRTARAVVDFRDCV